MSNTISTENCHHTCFVKSGTNATQPQDNARYFFFVITSHKHKDIIPKIEGQNAFILLG